MDLVEVILFQNKKPVNENINQILPNESDDCPLCLIHLGWKILRFKPSYLLVNRHKAQTYQT